MLVVNKMLFSKAVFIYFLLRLNKFCHGYEIPVPEIVAYEPRGISVNIPHSAGIRLFAFHANINKEIKVLQAGDYAKEVNRETNNKWGFYDPQVVVKAGDTIYYWIFVLKDGLGFRRSYQRFTITELEHAPIVQNVLKTSAYAMRDNINVDHCKNQNTVCLQSIVNVTQSLAQLQNELDIALKKNQQLKNFIEKMPDARKLVLSGRIPPDGNPASVASFVLRERVNVNPTIVSAQRNPDGSISFEVTTVDDKLYILQMAKLNLVTTKIFIQ